MRTILLVLLTPACIVSVDHRLATAPAADGKAHTCDGLSTASADALSLCAQNPGFSRVAATHMLLYTWHQGADGVVSDAMLVCYPNQAAQGDQWTGSGPMPVALKAAAGPTLNVWRDATGDVWVNGAFSLGTCQ